MDLIDYRRPRHRWSTADRQILSLFTRLYENSVEDAKTIINHLLQESLKVEGFRDGMSTSAIHAQLNEMSKDSPTHPIWRVIHMELTISEARKHFRETRDKIEDCALNLGISLRLHPTDTRKLKVRSRSMIKRARRSPWSTAVLGEHVSSSDDTETELPYPRSTKVVARDQSPMITPPKRVTGHPLTPRTDLSDGRRALTGRKKCVTSSTGVKALPMRQNVEQFGNRILEYPRLIYRSYDTHSQGLNTPTCIRAGKFHDLNERVPPPEWTREAVWNHLERGKQPSPYISFRQNMRACMFSAIKSEDESNSCIAIVDLQSFLAAAQRRWGVDDAAQWCPILVRRFGLRPGRNRSYTGTSEFLLYGEIQRDAIIATVRISDLLNYVLSNPIVTDVMRIDEFLRASTANSLRKSFLSFPPVMDFRAGKVVGSFAKFLRIPQEFIEYFSAKFARAWYLHGYKSLRSSKSYIDFMMGVFDEGSPERSIETFVDDVLNAVPIEHQQDDVFTSDNIEVERSESLYYTTANDQDLVDAQLQIELSSSFLYSTDLQEADAIMVNNDELLANSTTSLHNSRAESLSFPFSQTTQRAGRGSSTVPTFNRPTIAGRATNWEAGRSALDTFTAQLLAKAEDCSTLSIGSEQGQKSTSQQDPLIIDLASDGDDEDSVEELGLEIVGSRTIRGRSKDQLVEKGSGKVNCASQPRRASRLTEVRKQRVRGCRRFA